jgi:hypothetical protein
MSTYPRVCCLPWCEKRNPPGRAYCSYNHYLERKANDDRLFANASRVAIPQTPLKKSRIRPLPRTQPEPAGQPQMEAPDHTDLPVYTSRKIPRDLRVDGSGNVIIESNNPYGPLNPGTTA